MSKKWAIQVIELLLSKGEVFTADVVKNDYRVSDKVFNNLLVKYGY